MELLKGHFPVSDGHKIYFELVGNPKGKPVVFFHGGPGAGFDEGHKLRFNLKKFLVLFIDQRGAGLSSPRAELKNNTTTHLIADTFRLMDFVGFSSALFYGSSWGSTLALLTAISQPKRCSGLILSGIFLANKEVTEYLLTQAVWRWHFPEVWQRYVSAVGKAITANPTEVFKSYQKGILGKNENISRALAKQFSLMELSVVRPNLPLASLKKMAFSNYSHTSAKIELHYIENDCFISENFILKNLEKLKKIPTWIVHGRHDWVCPVSHAWLLNAKMKHSSLTITDEGHSSSSPKNARALKSALLQYSRL